MEKTLIIFDMDGTVVDTAKILTESLNFVRSKKNLPPLSVKKVIKLIYSGDKQKLIKEVFDSETFLHEDIALFEKHYEKQCEKKIEPYPQIIETLNYLKSNNIKLSVATNALTRYSKSIMQSSDLEKYFDFIVGSCKVKERKPAPDMMDLIIKKYSDNNIEIKNKFVVGDHFTDIIAAKRSNCKSVFVKWGYGNFNEDSIPDFQIDSPMQLIDIIKRLNA
jgi:phosphoglycolate phosphatase